MKIVITGEKGYMANALRRWLSGKNEDISVTCLSVRGEDWKSFDFTGVDALVHTAALVHQSEKDHELGEYRRINRDLTVELARRAKEQGVGHFVFISTMAVYGGRETCFGHVEIGKDTPLAPKTKYGITKYEAEQALEALQSESFRLTVVRPPFVYGKGCPGNYNSLRKLTLKLGLIPRLRNEKSMIYIDNLCECLYQILTRQLTGVICPQNERPVSTWELAELICRYNQKKALSTALGNPFVKLASLGIRKLRVAFGNEIYSPALTDRILDRKDYIVVPFEESIRLTEE